MNLSQFKTAIDGKMRPNRYSVSGKIGKHGDVKGILVKAASYPASQIGIIALPYRGRVAKIPGDRVYPEWTFSIYDSGAGGGDEGAKDLRKAFEQWNKDLNDHVTNTTTITNFSDTDTFTPWTVTLLDTDGTAVRTIKMHNCWPVEVGAIDLTYDAADTLTEYTVTLAFDYLEVDASTESQGGTDSGSGGEASTPS